MEFWSMLRLAMENNVDDVVFFPALIDKLEHDYAVEPKRIFVTGISNGGMMSYRLACELADKVAAIAPVEGGAGHPLPSIESGFCRHLSGNRRSPRSIQWRHRAISTGLQALRHPSCRYRIVLGEGKRMLADAETRGDCCAASRSLLRMQKRHLG